MKWAFIFVTLTLASFAVAAPNNAQIKRITLEYDVTRDGKPFATVKEQFKLDGDQYQIESVTKGKGFYALFGERKLVSTGQLTPEGLKPNRFEHQSDSPSKSLIADFDWQNQQLTMQAKGKNKVAVLAQHTQDLLSYAYQFRYQPPTQSIVNITLTTGKKLNQYEYAIDKKVETIHAANVDYKTIRLSYQSATDKKQIWLAKDAHFLPVRYQIEDESKGVLMQTLTKVYVE
jgi:Protein of unknown function (DUF3108)